MFVSKGGNIRVNAIYEAKLASHDKITWVSPEHEVKKFASDKYQRKLWYSKQCVVDDGIGESDDDIDNDSDGSSDW